MVFGRDFWERIGCVSGMLFAGRAAVGTVFLAHASSGTIKVNTMARAWLRYLQEMVVITVQIYSAKATDPIPDLVCWSFHRFNWTKCTHFPNFVATDPASL